jgi:GNAT superfamily N-acetyltransferase
MPLEIQTGKLISPAQFIEVLNHSGLGERRPVSDAACIARMLNNASLLCTAWEGDLLVGIARSVTDFSYCCYLSDLAVIKTHQNQGIGKQLIQETRNHLGPRCKVILLAAPAAQEYYPKLGFSQHPSAWLISAEAPPLA